MKKGLETVGDVHICVRHFSDAFSCDTPFCRIGVIGFHTVSLTNKIDSG